MSLPNVPSDSDAALAALRRFARPRPKGPTCELCAAPLAEPHAHLLEPAGRRLLCTCDACAVLFPSEASARYLRVPRRLVLLEGLDLDETLWESLRLPIDLAFFFYAGAERRPTAAYPSPAGAIESQLELEGWRSLAAREPRLTRLESEVEALLVNRVLGARECFIAPIDECFRLVGIVRTSWRGLSGGSAVRREIAAFFDDLRGRAGGKSGARHG